MVKKEKSNSETEGPVTSAFLDFRAPVPSQLVNALEPYGGAISVLAKEELARVKTRFEAIFEENLLPSFRMLFRESLEEIERIPSRPKYVDPAISDEERYGCVVHLSPVLSSTTEDTPRVMYAFVEAKGSGISLTYRVRFVDELPEFELLGMFEGLPPSNEAIVEFISRDNGAILIPSCQITSGRSLDAGNTLYWYFRENRGGYQSAFPAQSKEAHELSCGRWAALFTRENFAATCPGNYMPGLTRRHHAPAGLPLMHQLCEAWYATRGTAYKEYVAALNIPNHILDGATASFPESALEGASGATFLSRIKDFLGTEFTTRLDQVSGGMTGLDLGRRLKESLLAWLQVSRRPEDLSKTQSSLLGLLQKNRTKLESLYVPVLSKGRTQPTGNADPYTLLAIKTAFVPEQAERLLHADPFLLAADPDYFTRFRRQWETPKWYRALRKRLSDEQMTAIAPVLRAAFRSESLAREARRAPGVRQEALDAEEIDTVFREHFPALAQIVDSNEPEKIGFLVHVATADDATRAVLLKCNTQKQSLAAGRARAQEIFQTAEQDQALYGMISNYLVDAREIMARYVEARQPCGRSSMRTSYSEPKIIFPREVSNWAAALDKHLRGASSLALKDVVDIARRVHNVDHVFNARVYEVKLESAQPMFQCPRNLVEWRGQRASDGTVRMSPLGTEILRSTMDLQHYGHEFGHCLGNYVTSADKPEWFIRRGSAIAQVVWNSDSMTMRVQQCHGPQNQHTEEAATLERDLEKFFKGLSMPDRARLKQDIKIITKAQRKRLDKMKAKHRPCGSLEVQITEEDIMHMLPIPNVWPTEAAITAPAPVAAPAPVETVDSPFAQMSTEHILAAAMNASRVWRDSVQAGTTTLGFKEWFQLLQGEVDVRIARSLWKTDAADQEQEL